MINIDTAIHAIHCPHCDSTKVLVSAVKTSLGSSQVVEVDSDSVSSSYDLENTRNQVNIHLWCSACRKPSEITLNAEEEKTLIELK